MSDGNFNRALLPSTPYASGLKAGAARERIRAIAAFTQWIEQYHPELTAAEREEEVKRFRGMM